VPGSVVFSELNVVSRVARSGAVNADGDVKI